MPLITQAAHFYALLLTPLLANSCIIDAILHPDDGLERQINDLETSLSHLQIQNGKYSINLEEGG